MVADFYKGILLFALETDLLTTNFKVYLIQALQKQKIHKSDGSSTWDKSSFFQKPWSPDSYQIPSQTLMAMLLLTH